VKAAIERGAEKIMVVRSRGKEYRKENSIFDRIILRHVRDYPFLQETLKRRVNIYNESVELIRRPPAGVSMIEICPPENFRVSRLTRNRSILEEGYCRGRAASKEAIERWGI
jgi:predicted patatin/cPLA2 family phospholipase